MLGFLKKKIKKNSSAHVQQSKPKVEFTLPPMEKAVVIRKNTVKPVSEELHIIPEVPQGNEWLSEYEIKKPDYDRIERSFIGMADACYEPARYEKDGNWWVDKNKNVKDSVKVMFTGDITCFGRQFDDAKKGRSWDFRYEFDLVKPIFAEGDLVVGNLETMIVPNAPYRNEKFVSEQQYHCNAPLEFLDAVRYSGIDVVTNANNHDMDTGAVGIGETIDNIEKFGLIQTGTFKTAKKHYELINVKGFKVAVVAFAMEHNNKKNNLTDEGAEYLLNDYSKEKASGIISDARKDGAEIVFVCIHWGKEHKLTQNEEQEQIAKDLMAMGYDCIIGSHPHVLQPFDIIKDEENEIPVFYSMGNFVSHNADNNKARAIIACVDLKRTDDAIELECSYVPVITSKDYGSKRYVVLPIKADTTDENNIKNLKKITSVMGPKLSITDGIEFEEYVENKPPKTSSGTKKAKPDLSEIEEFPISYEDKKFVYSVYADHAVIEGFSKSAATSSYVVSGNVLGVPITELKEGAFSGNDKLMKMNFGKNMDVINTRACKGCNSIEGFQLGRGTKVIGEEAFAECGGLVCAVMREDVETIGKRAFADCKKLRSVKIPGNVTEIADDAFAGSEQAVFYCAKDSYGEKFAKDHGYKVVNMKFD